jgi:hypothetical protein
MPVADSPDFQVTVVVNTVPTADNPDWQVTATGPGGVPIGGGGGTLMGISVYAPALFVNWGTPGTAWEPVPNIGVTAITNATGPGSTSLLCVLSGQMRWVYPEQNAFCIADSALGQLSYGVFVGNESVGGALNPYVTVPILVPGLTPSTTYNLRWLMSAPNGASGGLLMQGVPQPAGDASQGSPAMMQVWSGMV